MKISIQLKIISLCLIVLSPGISLAGQSLESACTLINGTLKVKHYIKNINIKDRITHGGTRSNIVQILYDNQWYEVTGDAAPGILAAAQLGILLHKTMEVCVDPTVGQEKIMGIEFDLGM